MNNFLITIEALVWIAVHNFWPLLLFMLVLALGGYKRM